MKSCFHQLLFLFSVIWVISEVPICDQGCPLVTTEDRKAEAESFPSTASSSLSLQPLRSLRPGEQQKEKLGLLKEKSLHLEAAVLLNKSIFLQSELKEKKSPHLSWKSWYTVLWDNTVVLECYSHNYRLHISLSSAKVWIAVYKQKPQNKPEDSGTHRFASVCESEVFPQCICIYRYYKSWKIIYSVPIPSLSWSICMASWHCSNTNCKTQCPKSQCGKMAYLTWDNINMK